MKKQIFVLLVAALLVEVAVLPVTGIIVENQIDDKILLEGNDLTEDVLVETKKIVDNIDNPPFIINGKYNEGSNLSVNDNVDYEYINRDRIIEIALGYLNHEWYPTTENIFHGKYMGWQVDTPDRDTYTERPDEWGWKSNQLNTGVPYQWGGFSSISGFNLSSPYDFDEQYTGTGSYDGVIHYGGDIYTDKNFMCNKACGVDCSGFVSRCWDSPVKHGTYTLPGISSQIKFDELERGDVLNIPRYHVILFVEFVDDEKTSIRTIESGGSFPNVNEQIYNIRSVSNDGFYVNLEEYPRDKNFGLYRYDYIENAPLPPIINGPTNGKINENYSYNLYSTDPENDDIYYCINWGDSSSEICFGPYTSGTNVIINHTWAKSGIYEIRAKTMDIHDSESGWSDPLVISMPKNRDLSNIFFLKLFYWLFDRFPILKSVMKILDVNL